MSQDSKQISNTPSSVTAADDSDSSSSTSRQQPLLGVIGGSSFLKSSVASHFNASSIMTEYGLVRLYRGTDKWRNVIFVQRHGAHAHHEYSPPHLINKKAIIKALEKLVCRRCFSPSWFCVSMRILTRQAICI
jgi:purine nucleoside phosphorylase